jgi:hypothetical protein
MRTSVDGSVAAAVSTAVEPRDLEARSAAAGAHLLEELS